MFPDALNDCEFFGDTPLTFLLWRLGWFQFEKTDELIKCMIF